MIGVYSFQLALSLPIDQHYDTEFTLCVPLLSLPLAERVKIGCGGVVVILGLELLASLT